MIEIDRIQADKNKILSSKFSMEVAARKLSKLALKLIVIVNEDEVLQGVLTLGDIKKRKINYQPFFLNHDLEDKVIQKHLTRKITCIPLLDRDNRVTAIATLRKVHKKNNINIGSGGYQISGFKDLDVQSDWYSKAHAGKDLIEYDITKDILPVESNSIDNIYCSHVLEHLKDIHIMNFLNEGYRVMKSGACMRLVAPDYCFLHKVSKFDNDFWFWRREWFHQKMPSFDRSQLKQDDFLIRETITEKTLELRSASKKNIRKALKFTEFDKLKIGNHINIITYKKIRKFAKKIGFKVVLNSKYQACVSHDMQGPEFDKTHPNMSLYIDLVK